MHYLIRVLVVAKDATDALETARRVLRHLVGPNDPNVWSPPFDGASDFTKPDGTNHFNALPAVSQVSIPDFPCDDPTGWHQVDEALEHSRKEFKDYMKDLRGYVGKYTDDELFDVAAGNLPYSFKDAARYAAYGLVPFLYLAIDEDEDGPEEMKYPQRIVFRWQLEDVFRFRVFHEPLWVVPFDVHF
jgi:hypothetical protein